MKRQNWDRPTFLLVAAFFSTAVWAHDFWIEPATFRPAVGEVVRFAVRVGEHLVGDPVPRNPAMIRRFTMTDALGDRPVVGRAGSDPAGAARIERHGTHVVAFQSAPYFVELDGPTFTSYLHEEGLDHVIHERARSGASDRRAREFYSRSAKSLLVSGDARDDRSPDRALGLPIELVAERNPYALAAGDELPVQLLFEGKPLAGALVVAINRLDPSERHSARSDVDGRVRFRLVSDGLWLVKAVHMARATDPATADWQSWWASLTFGRGGSDERIAPDQSE